MSGDYPRDMVGYGRDAPHPRWPQGARIAIQIAVNYEAGAESSVLHGDRASEGALTDTPFPPALPGLRSPLVELVFEYGWRVGGWRLLRRSPVGLKVPRGLAMALERNPELTRAFVEDGHEIGSHGYRWLDYQTSPRRPSASMSASASL